MDILEIARLQGELDERIHSIHNIDTQTTIIERVLAFQVELGELANETRCFKYWSTKGPSGMDLISEEYADGLHFVIALGLNTNFNFDNNLWENEKPEIKLTDLFIDLYKISAEFAMNTSATNYELLIRRFIQLGYVLGLSKEDIGNAYVAKNKINHERQDNNY